VSVPAIAANAVWSAVAQGARRRFRAALRDPRSIQHALLAGYLERNAHTDFGRQANFQALLSAGSPADIVAAYQQSVPVRSYDDFDPFVARIAAGERGVLTAEPVLRLAPSSGSTTAAKLVPQTATSAREFSRAVDAWVGDLYRRTPALLSGQAYWSITPAVSFDAIAAARFGDRAGRPAVPVGFDDDAAYLGGLRRRLVDAILAVPNDVRLVTDPEAFQYVTLLFLMRARSLRLISVWHPSFLLQLLDAMDRWIDRVAGDLANGTLTPPGVVAPDVLARLRRRLTADPRRASELGRVNVRDVSSIWPGLTVVSCWGDGPALPYARRLAQSLPHATVQPKGLIATEAVVSIPFDGRHPLAIGSHFFEFIDAQGRPHLADALSPGGEYDVVLTTGGGLYRYALGDRITVTGSVDATPSVAFAGRSDRVSDRFGEKLSDGFVTAVLAQIFAATAPPRFAMLAPETTDAGVAYTLLVEPADTLPDRLDASLERALRQNPHYAWCVDLGQLRPARVVRVGPHADRAYLDACVARGQRLGDVKPAALHREDGWEARLASTT
jgi:hypothetical protein